MDGRCACLEEGQSLTSEWEESFRAHYSDALNNGGAVLSGSALQGWCNNWDEGSGAGVGPGRSYFADANEVECYAKCDADPLCEQAVYGGEGGRQCWLGLHGMTRYPDESRGGFVDFCYSKAGWDGIQVARRRV